MTSTLLAPWLRSRDEGVLPTPPARCGGGCIRGHEKGGGMGGSQTDCRKTDCTPSSRVPGNLEGSPKCLRVIAFDCTCTQPFTKRVPSTLSGVLNPRLGQPDEIDVRGIESRIRCQHC